MVLDMDSEKISPEERRHRRHQLVERFLVDVLSIPENKAHEEAKKLSSVMSDDTAEAIDLLMQHPGVCPDGNPIPGESHHPKDITTICSMADGECGTVVQLGYGIGQRQHLRSIGLREGKKIKIKGRQIGGGPIVLDVEGMEIALGRRMAARVLVKRAG